MRGHEQVIPVHAAVAAERPDAGLEQIQTESSGVFERLRSNRIAVAMTIAGVAVSSALGAERMSVDSAEASPVVLNETTTNSVQIGSSKLSIEDVASVTVMGNVRTISAAKMRRAEQRGNCVTINGKKQALYVEGRYEQGRAYGRDTRTSRFCKVGNVWYRKACGNRARFRMPRNTVPGRIIWVNNYNKASMTVSSKSVMDVRAECKSADGLASAYAQGRGEGYASARLRVKTAVRAGGSGARRVSNELSMQAKGEARSKASAQAEARCESSGSSGIIPVPPGPKPNNPPTVDLVDLQHTLTGGVVEVCAFGKDPDNDIIPSSRTIIESGEGNFSDTDTVYDGNEPGEFCRKFRAGTSEGAAVITATVTDSVGSRASDTESWPIVDAGQF